METNLPVARSLVARAILGLFGVVFLGVGILGYILPGLPGTLFLLIAAWLFSMSSPRLYHWMMTNRWFGRTLSDYRASLGIPRRIKVIAVTAIAVSVSMSIVYALDALWAQVGLIAFGLYGIYFVTSRPTREKVEAVATATR